MKTEKREVARIFEEVDGRYYVCDDGLSCLDARGYGYRTKAAAMRAAADAGYTHARGSGTYRGNKLTRLPAGRS